MDGAIGAEAALLSDPGELEETSADVVLAGRYRVLPYRRIEALDSPRAKAYAVIDEKQPSASLFCLVSPIEALPRMATARALQADPMDGLLAPAAAGFCHWPALGGTAAAFILSHPGGGRLAPGSAGGLSTADVVRRVLAPVSRVLSALEQQALTHRAIRADNLFWSGPDETEVVLGECVSAAGGVDQPVLYEPLDRMMAMPAGRGDGSSKDDLYALGVTLIDLIYGLRSANGYPATLASRKLEQGSLAALLPQVSPAPELAQLLRGLLTEDPERRWGTRQLSRWLAGERVEMPPPLPLTTSQRPIVLGKSRFRTARSLAHGLWQQQEKALVLLRDGTVERWLRVSAGDARMATTVAREAKEPAKRTVPRSLAREVLIERCCRILDPAGPVRFGSIATMPDAYGTILASVVLQHGDPADFRGLLRSLAAGSLSLWPDREAGATAAWQHLVQLLDGSGPGDGLLRCLYELNPDLPCLSPYLAEPATDLREVLQALDRRALQLSEGAALIDAHVAAYMASKLGLAPRQLSSMSADDGGSSGIRTELRLLALAQSRTGRMTLHALARTLAVRLAPVIRSLQNRGNRKRLAAAVAECVENGDLQGIADRIDDIALWHRDRTGFRNAQREYAARAQELERLKDPRRSGLSRAVREGQRLAAFVALSISVAVLSSLLLLA